jgi:type 1 glutamine amidotransferase
MIRNAVLFLVAGAIALSSTLAYAQLPKTFHVLALYSTNVETDHVQFAQQALQFFAAAATKDHFDFKSSTNWDDLNDLTLSQYQVVLWLNASPATEQQRLSFQRYMEHGGAWLGFHAAGYNDESTHWSWFVYFLGGAVFYGNSWPPLPAKLVVDEKTHPVAAHLPASFTSPANEWYIWKPDPRANKDVKVLLTLDPSNYPLGLKDTILDGDLPVVWTNTRYKMVYMNMGHGDRIFDNTTQNLLFENTLLWLGGRS